MKKQTIKRALILGLAIGLLLLTAATPKADVVYFDACVQDEACMFNCWYNTAHGYYNLSTASNTIKTGTGVVAVSADEFKLTDSGTGFKFKITVDLDTNMAMVAFTQGDIHIAFTGTKQEVCNCLQK